MPTLYINGPDSRRYIFSGPNKFGTQIVNTVAWQEQVDDAPAPDVSVKEAKK
jgi:hypothetical protein